MSDLNFNSKDFEESSFQRCPHDKGNPFTVLSNQLIDDKRLHPITRDILIHLLRKKGNWKILAKELINFYKEHENCGQKIIYRCLNQAIACGYLRREKYLDDKNLERTRYFISESATFSNNFSDVSHTDTSVEATHSKQYTSYTSKKAVSSSTTALSAKEKVKKENPEIYSALVEEFGQEEVDGKLNRIFDTINNPLKLLLTFLDKDRDKILSSPKNRLRNNCRFLDDLRNRFANTEQERLRFHLGPNYFEDLIGHENIPVTDKEFIQKTTRYLKCKGVNL